MFHFTAGPVLISLIVFNSLLVAFSVVFLQKSTKLLFSVEPRVAFIALTLSSSPILLNGPTPLREGIFWFGISVSVAALAYLYRARYATAILLLVVSILLILAIRPNYGVILAYLIAFAALAIWIFQIKPGLTTRTLIGAGCALGLTLSFAPAFTYLSQDLNSLGEQVNIVASNLSADGVTTAFRDPPSAPAEIPGLVERFLDSTLGASTARFSSLVLGPFWWEVGPEPVWLVVIASTLHYWFLLSTSLLLMMKRSNRNSLSVTLLLVSAIVIASLSLSLTNYGIIIRFRVISEIFLVPLSAGYLASRPRGIQKTRLFLTKAKGFWR